MKRLALSARLWRSGRRAQRGTWWLLFVCLLGCCAMFLYLFLSPYITNYHSIYCTLASMHTDISFDHSMSHEELKSIENILSESDTVDYYLLESNLKGSGEEIFSTVSTVVTTRHSLYEVQSSPYLCDSETGEPLDGCAYINAQYAFGGVLGIAAGDAFTVAGRDLVYTADIWGDDLFDVLVSNRDFAAWGRPVQRVIYGISPHASRGEVERLNERLGAQLPGAVFSVVMDKSQGVDVTGFLRQEGGYYLELSLVCLVTYYLLFRYLLDRRLRDLSVTRLVGASRGTLVGMLTGEGIFNALAAFLPEMALFSLYRLLFADEQLRLLLRIWQKSLWVLLGLVAVSALLCLLSAWRWVRRAPMTTEREAMG